jgi:hypothetical protein
MRIEVSGRPSTEESAAIIAAIDAIVDEESRALAVPALAPRQSSWVLAWRPREVSTPLPSHTYDAQPWAEIDTATPGEPTE